MPLNSMYVIAPSLQMYFVDKDTGLPLSGGMVYFYIDDGAMSNIPKDVFELTENPTYTYTPLPNPSILSAVGTFQDDSGNDILPYYYPYDADGNVQNYFIQVYDSNGVFQFSRAGWPNNTGTGGNVITDLETKNYIPNGQFLAHNTIVSSTQPPVATLPYISGNISSQPIAQGGWSFRHTSGGTSTFTNSFSSLISGIPPLNDFPRNAFNFQCTNYQTSDLVRDSFIQWPGANTFSTGDPTGSQPYTFFFAGTSNDSNTYVFDVFLVQYFGTGGSPSTSTETLLQTISISPGYNYFTISDITIPSGTLGTSGTDYVGIAIRGPASSWNVQVTDFVFALGNDTLLAFPIQTNAEMLDEGIAGWMPTPNPDGSDLYLPLVLTATGMKFDDGDIGKARASTTWLDQAAISTTTNELLANGASYPSTGYSPLGIPYSRLFNKYMNFDTASQVPLFGTGAAYVTAYNFNSAATFITLVNNAPGIQATTPANGTTSPGFTFPGLSGGNGGQNFVCNSNIFGVVTIQTNFTTATNAGNGIAAGTSTMAVANLRDNTLSGDYKYFTIQAIAASSLAAGGTNPGLYFTISNAGANLTYWFQVGTEVQPTVGGTTTYIKINLVSTMVAFDVGVVIANAVTGNQVYAVGFAAASGIVGGAYWYYYATGQLYYIWYTNNGVGSDPAPAGGIGYKVALLSTDTAAIVQQKTQLAINSAFFAVPNFQGVFLRGVDTNSIWDVDIGTRFGFGNSFLQGTQIGTFELDSTYIHNHPGSTVPGVNGEATASPWVAALGTSTTGTSTIPLTIASDGGGESRPVNANVNWYIRY